MPLANVFAELEAAQASGVIERYAIGGAVGATFYIEPAATQDLDVFVVFGPQPGLLLSITPVYEFFRERGAELQGEHLVIAPADGRVVSVAEVDEPDVIGGPALRVAVFMNVFNVHVNYHPMDGVVEYRQYRPGTFVNATLDKASVHNEQMSLGVRGGERRLMVRQIAGLIARRIVTDHELGDTVGQGSRLGLIRFGSRVDTFLPDHAEPRVRVGDRTVGGVTVIGAWVR